MKDLKGPGLVESYLDRWIRAQHHVRRTGSHQLLNKQGRWVSGRVHALGKGTVGGINAEGIPGHQPTDQFLHKVMENERKGRTQRAVSNW